MPPISWLKLREWNGSQSDAFEELCCQLAHNEPVPANSRFVAKGRPDSGLECYWVLPTGEEWGWQAKFFVDGMNKGRWSQCDDSVKKALQGHPKLTKLFFCIPHKFADPRKQGQISASDSWVCHSAKWVQWAEERGMSVELVLWNEHDLLSRLTKPENQGRFWFWFDTPAMDKDWFGRNLKGAISSAQDRYSPELHFELSLVEHFDALARRQAFTEKILKLSASLNDVAAKFCQNSKNDASEVLAAIRQSLHTVLSAINRLSFDPRNTIDFAGLRGSLQESHDELRNICSEHENKRKGQVAPQNAARSSAWDRHEYELRDIASSIRQFEEFCDSLDATLANSQVMLLIGEAGTGKTHLVCSVAERWDSLGLPTILTLGECFSDAEPWTRLIQQCGLSCDRDTFLGGLNSVGEAAGSRAVIFIDAINDGPGIQFWSKHIATMMEHVRAFPFVAIVFTVREGLLDRVSLPIAKMVTVDHCGFAEVSAEATRHFFRYYGLAEPNVPMLDPEFDTPLFLKLVCRALKNSSQSSLPDNLLGVSAIFNFVLTDVDKRLTERLDLTPGGSLVSKAVSRLADLMAENASEILPLDLARDELEQLHSSPHGFSNSLLFGLLTENVLIRVPAPFDNRESIRFAYQKLSDTLIIQSILNKTPKSALSSLLDKKIGVIGRRMHVPWLYDLAGWLEALAVQLPETYGVELDQFLKISWGNEVVRRSFISSLIWRKSTAFTNHAKSQIHVLLNSEHRHEVLNALICVTARPNHPLNADSLDRILRPFEMADRDAFWSTYLFGQTKDEGNVHRLIEWGWAERTQITFSPEVVRLASLTLIWCLTTSDRFVRDRATKALVSLLNQQIPILRHLIEHFSNVNEPYVQERLYAIAYGCAMFTRNTEELKQLAQYVYDKIFRDGFPPPSLLLRDHARGIVERAVSLGLQIDFNRSAIIPPYRSKWPKLPPTLDVLAKRFKSADYSEDSRGLWYIYNSVTRDDFSRYVIDDVCWWSDRRIKNRIDFSPQTQFHKLLAELPEESADTLKMYAKALERISDPPLYDTDTTHHKRFVRYVDSQLPQILGATRCRYFRAHLLPHLKDPHHKERQRVFSQELFQRLILRRVLQLGWTSERFDEFDRNVGPHSREAHKPERIGKKISVDSVRRIPRAHQRQFWIGRD